jgi:hypothetical protein
MRGLVEYEASEAAIQNEVNKAPAEIVFVAESALNMHRDGFFSEGTWVGIEGAALSMLRTPGGAQWWEYGRKFIGPEIVAHLNKRLAEIDPATPNFLDITPTSRKRLAELAAAS